METDFVYKMREIMTMRRVSGRRCPKCGSLPRDAGDLVGLLIQYNNPVNYKGENGQQ